MKVEGLPLEVLRTRTSEKWTGFAADVLPMPVAEMDFELAAPIQELLISMVTNSDTGYMGNTEHLTKNFAAFAAAKWGWDIDPEQLVLCTDVGVGMVEMARTIVQPGDKIMINTPIYVNMFNWIRELKCEEYDVPMRKDGMHYRFNLEAIEQGYKDGVKIHFICNPQNPTGTVHTRAELSAIAVLAKKYGVYVFSDEIHGPLVYQGTEFVPFLSISDAAREVGICVTAASKAWNLAGLKCAFIVTQSARTLALAQTMPHSVRFRASLFGAHATAKAFECTDWLDSLMQTLDGNRHFLKEQLDLKLPKAKFRIPDCSYLAWIDVTDYDLGENPAEVILHHGKLALSPGIIFGADCHQFVRLNFATSQELIAEGVDRLALAIKQAQQ